MSAPRAKLCLAPELVARFQAYHRRNEAWGALHIVLDDGNTDASSAAFCVEYAAKVGDVEGEALARILVQLSGTQRGKLGKLRVP